MMSPIALTTLIVVVNHTVKKMTNPRIGSWIKGQEALTSWLKESINQMDLVEGKTSAELILI